MKHLLLAALFILPEGVRADSPVRFMGSPPPKAPAPSISPGDPVSNISPDSLLSFMRGKALGSSQDLPPLGLGLLEAVPSKTLQEWAKINGGEISKSSPIADYENDFCSQMRDLSDTGKRDRRAYISLLGVPSRRNPSDQIVRRGSLVFRKIGCATCHVPEAETGPHFFPELSFQKIEAYTDLLLHDHGRGKKLRTAPLWSIGNVKHSTNLEKQINPAEGQTDGAQRHTKSVDPSTVRSVQSAREEFYSSSILWHGGESEDEKQNFRNLSRQERRDLFRFLDDL